MESPAPTRPLPLFAPLLAVAAAVLGQAFWVPGHLHSIPLLTIALVASLLALFHPPSWGAWLQGRSGDLTLAIVGAGVLGQIAALATTLYPGAALGLVGAGALVAVFMVAAELGGVVRFSRLRLPVLVALHFVAGAWIIHITPDPGIDVYVFHVEALKALAQGIDPYAITMPNIYSHEAFYGPGLVVDGRLQFGFLYPPLSLLLSGVGHLIGGDYRFANLAAMGLTALLIGTCRPGRLAVASASLFLFTPKTFFVVEQGWTEPYVVLLLAATIWCACRAPRLMPFALGLFFAVKQYAPLAAPLVVLLCSSAAPWRDTIRALVKAVLVAAVVTLPFVLWNPGAFERAVVVLQFLQPFRFDSISYPAVWARLTGEIAPWWLGFALLPLVLVLGLRRAPRTPAGFAAAVAATFIVFFAFNKQAFANYYFFVIGALCCALASADPAAPSGDAR